MTGVVKPQPRRVIVGHCPSCLRVLVVCNDGESWPLVGCECSWTGPTTSVVNRVRYENQGRIAP